MNKFKLLIAVSIILSGGILISSCTRTTEGPTILGGTAYYPLALGKYMVYDVDSIYWDSELGEEIPVRWQFRYDFADTFRNDEGDLTFTVDISKRRATTTPYQAEDVMHITPFEDRIELKYNYLQYVIFKLPVDASIHWDILYYILKDPENVNKYVEFTSDQWDAHYTNIGVPYNTELYHFDKTLTVMHIDDVKGDPGTDTTAQAHRFYSEEIYAEGLGLIYKHQEAWTFEPVAPYGTGKGYKQGYAVRMRIAEFN